MHLAVMYQGGKTRQAPHLARAIATAAQGRTRYLEPFLGGGNILVRTPTTWHRWASDSHLDLILMWRAVQAGWQPPHHVTRETYDELRDAHPSPLRGFVGYACSWGAKWFGGYGTNGAGLDLADASARWLVNHAHLIANVTFTTADYRSHHPGPDTIVYCDPPYADTTGYRGRFNHREFWATMNTWVEHGAAVLVSEFTAPEDWIGVRVRERYLSDATTIHVTESLYRHRNEHQPALGGTR